MTTTPTTTTVPGPGATRAEGIVQIVIMLAIGGAAGAASFTHVHNVAAAHGQGGWLAWADAVVLELMSIASGLEMRRRKRQHKPVVFPAAVLVCAVALSISAQVVEAEMSVIGWIAAALPALGFLVMVKIALGRATATGPGPVNDTRTETGTGAERDLTAYDGRGLVPDNANGHPDRPVSTPVAGDTSPSGTTGRSGADRSTGTPGIRSLDPAEVADVIHVLPAATAARDVLAEQGRAVTRKALTEQLRNDGHPVSNARASVLVKILKVDESPSADDHDAEIIQMGLDSTDPDEPREGAA